MAGPLRQPFPILRERIKDNTHVPSPTDLARDLGGDKAFVHQLPPLPTGVTQVSIAPGSKARCGEVPAGGFRLVTDAEFRKRPCPDCLRNEAKTRGPSAA